MAINATIKIKNKNVEQVKSRIEQALSQAGISNVVFNIKKVSKNSNSLNNSTINTFITNNQISI